MLKNEFERVNMYAYLKDNTFYLRLNNDGLFLKNSYADINVATPKSYYLFMTLVKYLDGKNDIDILIDNIENDKVKNYYRKLLQVLKEQKFVLYDENEIDIEKYSDDEKQLLYYFSDLKDWKKYDGTKVRVEIEGPSQEIVNIFTEIFSKRINAEGKVSKKNYIEIKLYCDDEIKYLYIYKDKQEDALIISCDKSDDASEKLESLPYHVYEIIAALLEIEIWLRVHNAPVDDFFEKDYSFDLKVLKGKHVERALSDAS